MVTRATRATIRLVNFIPLGGEIMSNHMQSTRPKLNWVSRRIGELNELIGNERVYVRDTFATGVERFEASAFRMHRGRIQARCIAGYWVDLSDKATYGKGLGVGREVERFVYP
jgi:hypothetical protein